jgi:hypothetical protein
MKWIGERISFLEDNQKSTFVIYPAAKTIVKALMGSWLAMWLMIGISVLLYVNQQNYKLSDKENLNDQLNIIVFVFLVFWAYYAVKVARSFAWLLWGKEFIKVNEASLTYKRSIKSYGKATPYYLENIKKIRIYQPKENSLHAVWDASPWVKGGERLEFDYLGKTIRFGRKLNEKDGKLFFNLLTKKVEERLRKVKN